MLHMPFHWNGARDLSTDERLESRSRCEVRPPGIDGGQPAKQAGQQGFPGIL